MNSSSSFKELNQSGGEIARNRKKQMEIATAQDFAKYVQNIKLPWKDMKIRAHQDSAHRKEFVMCIAEILVTEGTNERVCLVTNKIVVINDLFALAQEVATLILDKEKIA